MPASTRRQSGSAPIGHSHVALFFTRHDGARGHVRGAQASDGTLLETGDGRWLVNPGSVGQPRDGDPRAAWLALDTEADTVMFHRVWYDIERTAESIAAAKPAETARRPPLRRPLTRRCR